MANWRTNRPTPSRLEEGREVYTLVLDIADRLDSADLDLWAGGLRSCLDAGSTLERQRHLVLELVRLRDGGAARSAHCTDDVQRALARLELGLGGIDIPQQPLYTATRNLADHLELLGGRRWLGRLRMVARDPERSAEVRMERFGALLDRMEPGTPDLPERTAPRVRAVRERLERHVDVSVVAQCIGFALTPPTPSRVRSLPGDGHGGHDAPQVAQGRPTSR